MLLTILGFILLGVGAVGVVVPLLPTTPLVLAAAICFAVGNSKMSQWLEKSRVFGPFIDNYRRKLGVELRVKVYSIIFLWFGLGLSAYFTGRIWVYPILLVVGIAVTTHILMLKTRKNKRSDNKSDRAAGCGDTYTD